MTPELLQTAAFQVAQSRTLAEAFHAIVVGLASADGVALARIWLVDQGDRCGSCSQAPVCEKRETCLHLKASAGQSLDGDQPPWTRIDGVFQRLPLSGVRKIGQVASTGNALLLNNLEQDTRWIARPEWVARERIQSVAAQPLIFRGEVLGALALFSRKRLSEVELGWLGTFADRAAASLVNARAFDEIAQLKNQLEAERDYLRVEVKAASNFGAIIGSSPAIRELQRQIGLVAKTDATVLLHGESGTGKELAAVAIHESSARSDKPLVRVNCASIPRELFESEFFGHARGSFSGAVRDRKGRFEIADRGTLFLDELGEIPLDLQSKLLRVLQEGTFERVGDERTRKVDVRVIAATNRDLSQEVAEGRFREDLYYRLNVFPIDMPPLRDRGEDILELSTHFIALCSRRLGREKVHLTRDQGDALMNYSWPGNVRELANLVERALILSGSRTLNLEGLLPGRASRCPPDTNGAPSSESRSNSPRPQFLTDQQIRELERQNLVNVLRRCGGRVSGEGGAAELLQVKASTLASRMKKMDIRRSEYDD